MWVSKEQKEESLKALNKGLKEIYGMTESEFKRALLVLPKQEEPLLTRQEIDKLWESDVRFTEEYRRGVHETWGGRAIVVYDILYRIINESKK